MSCGTTFTLRPARARIPSPAEQRLSIAEAYAFGAATSRHIEGRFLYGLIKGEPEAREAWAAIAQYNHFMVEHRELYHQAEPAARIALISAEPQNLLATNSSSRVSSSRPKCSRTWTRESPGPVQGAGHAA
jgi:hypothetical protein